MCAGDISWTTAYVNLVHAMWRFYGDTRLMQVHYAAMRRQLLFVDAQKDPKTNLFPVDTNVSRYGDWCAVAPNTTASDSQLGTDGSCPHNSALLNTFTFAKECFFFSQFAQLLNESQDYALFQDKFTASKQAIYDNFWDADKGCFMDDNGDGPLNQTAPFSTLQALALNLGVLTNASEMASCVAAMVADIRQKNRGHLYEGIIGVRYILSELCKHGECALAVNATLQSGYPSFEYWLSNGATTLWEEWATARYDNHGGSKNHVMFGAQSGFFFEYVAGMRQDANSVNWKRIVIDPFANCSALGVDVVRSRVDTLRGAVAVSLTVDAHAKTEWLNVSIPSG